jgi:hypothetical protein
MGVFLGRREWQTRHPVHSAGTSRVFTFLGITGADRLNRKVACGNSQSRSVAAANRAAGMGVLAQKQRTNAAHNLHSRPRFTKISRR